MLEKLKRFIVFMRLAFSRRATYCWFVVVFVGFILRTDNFGVSSIVRVLTLAPENYTCLLHFFHSNAWSVEGIYTDLRYALLRIPSVEMTDRVVRFCGCWERSVLKARPCTPEPGRPD